MSKSVVSGTASELIRILKRDCTDKLREASLVIFGVSTGCDLFMSKEASVQRLCIPIKVCHDT
jgi:hypothetical protein